MRSTRSKVGLMLSSVLLLLSSFGLSNPATTMAAEYLVLPIADYIDQCNILDTNEWGGIEEPRQNTATYITGAWADIESGTRLGECEEGLPDYGSGASYWVSIEGNEDQEILQIGVINCRDDPSDICAGSTGYRYFMAAGNNHTCNGFGPTEPWPLTIGPTTATAGYHDFRVWWDRDHGSGHIRFYIDGVQYADYNDSRYECWLDDYSSVWAGFYVERWDQGDGAGFNAANPIRFRNAKAGNYGVGWLNTTFSTGEYQKTGSEANEFIIAHQSATGFNLYTVQQ